LLDAALSETGHALGQRQCGTVDRDAPSVASLTATVATEPYPGEPGRYQEVDLDSLDLGRPRNVGVEHAELSAMRQCGFEDKLADFGFNRPRSPRPWTTSSAPCRTRAVNSPRTRGRSARR
jgi:hypothetical protein